MILRQNPFPHFVWDNFLEDKVAEEAQSIFPTEDSTLWTWKSNDENSIKYMCQDIDKIKTLPLLYKIIEYLNSEEFCNMLSIISGIPNLVGDMRIGGGGLHMIGNGGFLKLHSDFNVADTMLDYHRRMNLIYYLSDDWKDDYNGHLELWNTDLTECVVKLSPIFNRVACFVTQPEGDTISWHGHPEPLNTPTDVYRKSIALYYYTKEKPNNILADKHKTIYRDAA
jgi:Rps23 Pro-64 3,4-dihydroxylase Tpa1-like proline 4-hydroxylase